MDRIIAIGDIHGCFYTLLNLINKLNYNEKTDTLIFLGDYIDRGKNSYEVVHYLKNLQKKVGQDKCVCLLGNHEYMYLTSYEDEKRLWYNNGGKHTERSYYKHNRHISDDKWWFETLPAYYETDKYIFCHAGLSHNEIKLNTLEDLIWGRRWIDWKTTTNPKQVVFGHTPYNRPDIYKTKDGSICIDAGCVFGGRLCAMIITDEKYEFVYCDKSEDD